MNRIFYCPTCDEYSYRARTLHMNMVNLDLQNNHGEPADFILEYEDKSVITNNELIAAFCKKNHPVKVVEFNVCPRHKWEYNPYYEYSGSAIIGRRCTICYKYQKGISKQGRDQTIIVYVDDEE